MEIDVTEFVTNEDPYEFSGSVAERGQNAGRETWHNAVTEAVHKPLLTTPEQLDALRDHVKGFGAWEDAEITAWSDAECNALFIQLISGDMREAEPKAMREAGMDDCELDEFDWDHYEANASAGRISGNVYRGDDDRIYYYLGN